VDAVPAPTALSCARDRISVRYSERLLFRALSFFPLSCASLACACVSVCVCVKRWILLVCVCVRFCVCVRDFACVREILHVYEIVFECACENSRERERGRERDFAFEVMKGQKTKERGHQVLSTHVKYFNLGFLRRWHT